VKIEKIIGIGFFIATLSLMGMQFYIRNTYIFEPYTYIGYAKSVYVEDDIAYIADDSYGLVIMDVSAPSKAYELGRLSQGPSWGHGLQIYVRNQVAYLVGNHKLRLIDISNLSSPSQFSELDISGSEINGMYVDFPHFYLYGGSNFWIYNFSNYFSPSQLGHINLGHSINNIYVSNNIAYITYNNGLKTIDVSNSSNPTELGQFGDVNYYGCVVEDNIAYVKTRHYIDIIDVSVPSNPTKLSQFDEGGIIVLEYGIDVLDDTLYVTGLSDGLELIDVSDPLKPFKYAQFSLRIPFDLYIKFPYAYIACADDGLKIVDISNASFWNQIPSILNFAITITSIGVIVSLILLKLRIQKKKV